MSKVIKGGVGAFPSQAPSQQPRPPVGRGPATMATLPPKNKVIEREVVGANQEARRIVAEAEAQAAKILEEAETQREELRTKGYEEGYQEGLGKYTEQTIAALQQVEHLKAALEPEYIKLVRTCVEKIIGHEIKTSPETIVGIVRTALRDATQQREITVRVNPADAEQLRKHQRRLLDVLARATSIEIREDPTIARGGTVIITELGTIDASLERQLAALETALEEELASGGASPEGEAGEPPPDDEEPLEE